MKTLLSFLGAAIALAISIITTTSKSDVVRNVQSYLPALPLLPSWVRPVVFAISVMVASICFGTTIILLFRRPPKHVATKNLMSRYYDGEFELVYPDDLRRKRKQERLDELSKFKAPLAALRIEMENDRAGTTSVGAYKEKTEALRAQIASKIEEVSGNLDRRISPVPHQLYIDILIRDLDYLDKFIERHSG